MLMLQYTLDRLKLIVTKYPLCACCNSECSACTGSLSPLQAPREHRGQTGKKKKNSRAGIQTQGVGFRAYAIPTLPLTTPGFLEWLFTRGRDGGRYLFSIVEVVIYSHSVSFSITATVHWWYSFLSHEHKNSQDRWKSNLFILNAWLQQEAGNWCKINRVWCPSSCRWSILDIKLVYRIHPNNKVLQMLTAENTTNYHGGGGYFSGHCQIPIYRYTTLLWSPLRYKVFPLGFICRKT